MNNKKTIKLKIVNCKAEFKLIETKDEGRVMEAYVSIFGNVDLGGDRIIKGAFTESLKRKLPIGVWMHDWNKPITKTLEAREDDKGLYIKALFVDGVQQSDEAYKLIKADVITEFSIGYTVEDDEVVDGVRNLKKLRVFEYSPVVAGMNPDTELIGIKGIEIDEDEKADPKEGDACQMEDGTDGVLAPDADGNLVCTLVKKTEAEEKGAVQETLNAEQTWEKKWENLRKVSEVINAFYDVYLKNETTLESFEGLLSETVDLLKGILPADTTASKDLVKALVGLSKSRYCLDKDESKDGRVLSEKNRGLVQDVVDNLESLSKAITSTISPLKDLLSATESKGEKVEAEPNSQVAKKTVFRIKQALKQADKANEFALRLVKKI